MPHHNFNELHETMMSNEMFRQWTKKDAVGDEPCDTKLLLLGALRYTGRAWTFDCIEEATGISRETNRQFFSPLLNMGVQYCTKDLF